MCLRLRKPAVIAVMLASLLLSQNTGNDAGAPGKAAAARGAETPAVARATPAPSPAQPQVFGFATV